MNLNRRFLSDQHPLYLAAITCDSKAIEDSLIELTRTNDSKTHLGDALILVALKSLVGLDPIGSATKLIDAGASLDATTDGGRTALCFAVENSDFALVTLLLDAGANARPNGIADNPLDDANNEQTVELLLDRGANPFEPGASGETPYQENLEQISDLENDPFREDHDDEHLIWFKRKKEIFDLWKNKS